MASSGFGATYVVLTMLYLCGWIIALCGLAALQNRCYDNTTVYVEWGQYSGYLLSPELGDSCSKLFRFPWFVVWLSFFPMFFHGRHIRKAGIMLYAATTPLLVLMANLLNNVSDLDSIHGSAEDSAKAALSGFAIMAGFALLLMTIGIIAESMRDDESYDARSSTGTGGGKHMAQQPPVTVTV